MACRLARKACSMENLVGAELVCHMLPRENPPQGLPSVVVEGQRLSSVVVVVVKERIQPSMLADSV